jgi:hypothetical protein
MPTDGTDIQKKIIYYFASNPGLKLEQIKKFAINLGISTDIFEAEVYNLLASYINDIGKHNNIPDSEFDPEELALGIKIEMEHTDNPAIALSITKDHLSEFEKYNTMLVDMENQAKKVSKNQPFKDAVRGAQKVQEVSATVATTDLLDHLIGDIHGYYRNGLFFEHDDGVASIDGQDLLNYLLEQLVDDFEVGKSKTKIFMNPKSIQEYMEGSGYRAIDYTIADAIDDFKDDPIGMLQGMKAAFGSHVNPFDYAKEEEYFEPEEYEEEENTEELE